MVIGIAAGVGGLGFDSHPDKLDAVCLRCDVSSKRVTEVVAGEKWVPSLVSSPSIMKA